MIIWAKWRGGGDIVKDRRVNSFLFPVLRNILKEYFLFFIHLIIIIIIIIIIFIRIFNRLRLIYIKTLQN